MRKTWLALLAASSLIARPAAAADYTLLTTGAFKQAALALVAQFEAASLGHDYVHIETDTAGGVLRRIKAGQKADVVIVTPTVIDSLIITPLSTPKCAANCLPSGITPTPI